MRDKEFEYTINVVLYHSLCPVASIEVAIADGLCEVL